MPSTNLPSQLTRRSMIAGVAALPLAQPSSLNNLAAFAAERESFTIREREPQNLESDFSALQSVITPAEKFFVRNHFPIPQLDATTWRLRITGSVRKPIEISYEELLKMPSETRPVTLECAGNGRVFLVPKADGTLWQFGAVGNAEWTGVPLAAVLARAEVTPAAVDIIFEGADAGDVSKPSRPAKPFHFARSVPLERAQSGGILLAYRMNGKPLSDAHGFPVRAIVPGWYGMASVKWLTRIVAADQPFHGYFQTVDYATWKHRDGMPERVPLSEMQVKAQIARPTFGETVTRGGRYRVFGAAWAGNSAIAKVELSTDNGKSWSMAQLLGENVKSTWRLWEYSWNVPDQAGRNILKVRATDVDGNSQPLERDKDRENYMINHVVGIEVRVV